jgi:hypothetical protein
MAIRTEKPLETTPFTRSGGSACVSRRNHYLHNRSRLLEELAKELKRVLNRRPQ